MAGRGAGEGAGLLVAGACFLGAGAGAFLTGVCLIGAGFCLTGAGTGACFTGGGVCFTGVGFCLVGKFLIILLCFEGNARLNSGCAGNLGCAILRWRGLLRPVYLILD